MSAWTKLRRCHLWRQEAPISHCEGGGGQRRAITVRRRDPQHPEEHPLAKKRRRTHTKGTLVTSSAPPLSPPLPRHTAVYARGNEEKGNHPRSGPSCSYPTSFTQTHTQNYSAAEYSAVDPSRYQQDNTT